MPARGELRSRFRGLPHPVQRLVPPQGDGDLQEISASGATVVGKGKPGVPGGTVIPPTTVEIK